MDDTLEKIYRAGLKFLVPLSPEETYDIIIKESLKLVDAQYSSIFLEQEGVLKRARTSDEKMNVIKPRNNGYTYRTFRTGKPHLISAKELEKIHPTSRGLGIKSTLFLPLSYRNHCIGVLSMHRTSDQNFTKEQLNILELFGSYISLAIRKTHLNSELAETVKARDLFIAMAAHELKTPLTSVSGYIQLLYNRYENENSLEANWIKHLYHESIRLNKLAKELLEINQVRLGKLSFYWQERDLIEVIRRSIASSRLVFPERTIILKNFTDKKAVTVICDFDKLIQVLTNVIENAIKYSPEDKPIELVFEEKKKYYCLSIIDTGSGIPRKDIKKIGQEFYKGENSVAEGMGLGLYLANYIVNHHKGMLKIRSRLKVGTKVFISIPKLLNEQSRTSTTEI